MPPSTRRRPPRFLPTLPPDCWPRWALWLLVLLLACPWPTGWDGTAEVAGETVLTTDDSDDDPEKPGPRCKSAHPAGDANEAALPARHRLGFRRTMPPSGARPTAERRSPGWPAAPAAAAALPFLPGSEHCQRNGIGTPLRC